MSFVNSFIDNHITFYDRKKIGKERFSVTTKMKKKPELKFDKEESLLSRIEKNREKINDMINLDKGITFNKRIVKMSQYLDKLIVEYMRCSRGEQSGEKDQES